MSIENILETEGINSKGFGIFPKSLAIDTRISADAKAIYAYLTSYAGAGKTAFPGVDLMMVHLGMGRERFYNARGVLEAYGYITIKQTFKKDENGINRRGKNIYTLCTNPKVVPELLKALEDKKDKKKKKKSKTKKPTTVDISTSVQQYDFDTVGENTPSQQYDFQTVGNQQFGNQQFGNDTINNNSLKNNSININNNKKNRKEKIKENIETENIEENTETETEHSFSDLSQSMPKLPREFIEDLDPYFVKRLLKDRSLYNLDFNDTDLYNIFAEAVTKTMIQDNVEVLTIRQYPYFIKTIKNMIDPIRRKIELNKLIAADLEV